MVDLLALQERLLEVALQRNLVGFEQALKRALTLFGLNGWACIFPPSLQAGGQPLFVAHGVKPGASPALARAFREGLATGLLHPEAGPRLLATVAREIAPEAGSRCRIFRISREREIEFVLICYRPGGAVDFDAEEVGLLTRMGRLVDRCFQTLAQDQQQEFLANLFRMVGNLHPEGLCIVDERLRVLFENRLFREHMHLWSHGPEAARNLSLPRAVELPADWRRACEQAFVTLRQLKMPASSGKMAVSQGAIVRLERAVGEERIDGAVRHVAFQTPFGMRPYAMLTSSIRRTEVAAGPVPLERLAGALGLSRREEELAGLILAGASAREIAARLRIALPTVKTHIRHILSKAGVRTRLEFTGLCRDPRLGRSGEVPARG